MHLILPKEKYQREELIATHLSRSDPVPEIIRPEGFYNPESARSTIHFSLNGVVKDHSGSGNHPYKERQWAIVVPLMDIVDRIEAFASEDTYIIGDLNRDLVRVMASDEVENYCRSKGYFWKELNANGWRGWNGPQQEQLARDLGFDDTPHKLHWTYKLEDLFYRQLKEPSKYLAERIRTVLDRHGRQLPDYVLAKVEYII